MSLPPRFAITGKQIDRVVKVFYAKVRDHATLGPVSAAHITDCPVHEAKIAAFWRNAILKERAYDGNPMQKHIAAGNVRPEHFSDWPGLFVQVLTSELDARPAQAWSDLAHRIGQGLRFGLETCVRGEDGIKVPRL